MLLRHRPQELLFLLEIMAVSSVEFAQDALFDLDRLCRDLIDEITVVRDEEEGETLFEDQLFEKLNVDVEMVGRLVKEGEYRV